MHSEFTKPGDTYNDNVILITQFYLPSNDYRKNEIFDCLKKNLNNNLINQIYLVTEKIYDIKSLLVNAKNLDKIKQINIGKRMKYSDAFNIVDDYNLSGYIILANSDIFFDNTISNIYKSGLNNTKKVYSQLRFEYTEPNLNNCKLFGPRGDSQDTWIFHSNYNIIKSQRNVFNFELGIPGCDNHVNYLFAILGFSLHNEPYFIKTYHNHTSQFRTYNSTSARVIKPWVRVQPVIHENIPNWVNPNKNWWRFNIIQEHKNLCNYIKNKVNKNENFIIPQVSTLENNFVVNSINLNLNSIDNNLIQEIKRELQNMNRDYIINISGLDNAIKYSKKYLKSFEQCDAYFEHEPFTKNYVLNLESHNYINEKFQQKKQFSINNLDIFNNIYNNPWTICLASKKILIISPFINCLKDKVDILQNIYGVDLFPNCKFIFLQSPGIKNDLNVKEYDLELSEFMKKIKTNINDFDVALCYSPGFGNLICSEIYEMGKSAVNVGSTLQMYFGVYNNSIMIENPVIFRLFMNKYWSRYKND